jgi:hypothetical protein
VQAKCKECDARLCICECFEVHKNKNIQSVMYYGVLVGFKTIEILNEQVRKRKSGVLSSVFH